VSPVPRGVWDETSSSPFCFLSWPVVLRHGSMMLAHTLRGMILETLLSFEDERMAFQRY
jgi:hypothetical protein